MSKLLTFLFQLPHWRSQAFGVLYTVSKEKRVSPLFVAVRLLLDVLQLWLLIVQPQNGYDIRSDWLLWRIVSFLGLNQFYEARSYTFFLGSLYIMIVLLVFVLGLCVWVGQAFKENRFSYVWPIQVRHEPGARTCLVHVTVDA